MISTADLGFDSNQVKAGQHGAGECGGCLGGLHHRDSLYRLYCAEDTEVNAVEVRDHIENSRWEATYRARSYPCGGYCN